ncbi:MAG: biotin-dependent carboxyltransferase family protein [Chloroflexi bacterium]|nr:biotin-dependent carboxyltransferase family protein [Chloroflexota bacterium]
MTGAALRVISPGPLSTVQDLGRSGYQRFGVSVSGAADRYALRLGNLLTGNDQRSAAVEVTLGGAEFEFTGNAIFAITGADLNATLNGSPVPVWETMNSGARDRLSLNSPAGPGSGLRAYVNMSGGIDTPQVLGSRSTHVAARLGGIDGRALEPGDELPIGPVTNPVEVRRRVPDELLPAYGGELVARVVPGPQDDRFDAEATALFYGSVYIVSDRSDRMGCRLDGPVIRAIDGAHDIISDGVVTGAIQVPGDGQPIILLADRQTTGGYVKIGVIASVDLALVAQAAPGTAVRFERISAAEAQSLARARMAALRDVKIETREMPIPDTSDPARRRYRFRIGGRDYEVDIDGNAQHVPGAAHVNGVEYNVQVNPGG